MTNTYTKFRWFALITLLIATMGNGVSLIALSPNIADVAATLGVDLGQTSAIVMLTYNLASVIMGLFCGKLLDKFGAGKVFTVCFIGNIIITLLYLPIGATVAGLMFIRLAQGALMVSTISSAAHVAAVWFPIKERGLVVGIQAAFVAGGVALGMMMSPRFTAMTGSWQKGAAMCVIVSVIALICAFILAMKKPPVVEEIQGNGGELIDSDAMFKTVWKQPLVYLCCLVGIAFGWVFNVFNDLIPGYAAVDAPVGAGYGPVAAGSMLSMGQIGFMIGGILAGTVIIRLVKGRVRVPLVLMFLIAMIALLMLNQEGIISSYAKMQTVVIIAGFCIGSFNPYNMGLIAINYHPAISGRVGAMVMALTTLGGVIGLAVSSALISATGFYHKTILVIAVVSLAGAIFALGLKPAKKIQM